MRYLMDSREIIVGDKVIVYFLTTRSKLTTNLGKYWNSRETLEKN